LWWLFRDEEEDVDTSGEMRWSGGALRTRLVRVESVMGEENGRGRMHSSAADRMILRTAMVFVVWKKLRRLTKLAENSRGRMACEG